jgi:hypothetical protein
MKAFNLYLSSRLTTVNSVSRAGRVTARWKPRKLAFPPAPADDGALVDGGRPLLIVLVGIRPGGGRTRHVPLRLQVRHHPRHHGEPEEGDGHQEQAGGPQRPGQAGGEPGPEYGAGGAAHRGCHDRRDLLATEVCEALMRTSHGTRSAPRWTDC